MIRAALLLLTLAAVWLLGAWIADRYSKRGRLIRRYVQACELYGARSERARAIHHALLRLSASH